MRCARVDVGDEPFGLEVIVGYDDDVAGQVTAQANQIRGLLLTQVSPALERVLGPRTQHPSVLELLTRFAGRMGCAKRVDDACSPLPNLGHHVLRSLVTDVLAALGEQTVTMPGTHAAELVLPQLATTLARLLAQRADAAKEIEGMLDPHPLATVLTSMPGVGVRTGPRILLEVGDGSAFPTSSHLAAYAGVAPVTRRSGTSICGEHPASGGNKHLKRAMFLAAFPALHDPTSRAYYDRRRAQGKKHNAALICLARRRCDVLFAMLRDGTVYEQKSPTGA